MHFAELPCIPLLSYTQQQLTSAETTTFNSSDHPRNSAPRKCNAVALGVGRGGGFVTVALCVPGWVTEQRLGQLPAAVEEGRLQRRRGGALPLQRLGNGNEGEVRAPFGCPRRIRAPLTCSLPTRKTGDSSKRVGHRSIGRRGRGTMPQRGGRVPATITPPPAPLVVVLSHTNWPGLGSIHERRRARGGRSRPSQSPPPTRGTATSHPRLFR